MDNTKSPNVENSIGSQDSRPQLIRWFCLGALIFTWLAYAIAGHVYIPEIPLVIITALLIMVFVCASMFRRIVRILILACLIFCGLYFFISNLTSLEITNRTDQSVDVYVVDMFLNKNRHQTIAPGQKSVLQWSASEVPNIRSKNRYLLLAVDEDCRILYNQKFTMTDLENPVSIEIR
jgi:hypothetical protein